MILIFEMILSVISYERKNIIICKKILNLVKIIFSTMFFVKEFFFFIVFYLFFNNDWIFIIHGLFFQGKYSLELYFPILKISNKPSNIVIFKEIFSF